jgi:hypothetical protein
VKTQGAPSIRPEAFWIQFSKSPTSSRTPVASKGPAAVLIPHSSTPVPRSSKPFPTLRGADRTGSGSFPPGNVTRARSPAPFPIPRAPRRPRNGGTSPGNGTPVRNYTMHIIKNNPFPTGNVSRRMGNEPFPVRRIAFPVVNVIRCMGNKAPAVTAGALGGLCIISGRRRSPPPGLDNSSPGLHPMCINSVCPEAPPGVSSDGERAGDFHGSRDPPALPASGVESASEDLPRTARAH